MWSDLHAVSRFSQRNAVVSQPATCAARALVSLFLRDLSLFQKLLDSSTKLIDSIGTELKSYLQTLSNLVFNTNFTCMCPSMKLLW